MYFWYLLPVTAMATYFVIEYLIPVFLLRKRYALFFLLFILSAAVFTLAQKAVYFFLLVPNEYDPEVAAYYLEAGFWNYYYLIMILVSTYNVVIAGSFIKLIKIWYLNEKMRRQLSEEKQTVEMKYLRSQLDAHFLFNSLNNLYALARKQSADTPEMIMRLSKMLSFILHDCSRERITLGMEIELIESYIALEKLRFGDRLKLEMNLEKDTKEISLAPLLIFPLIENAFKHGAGKVAVDPWIDIAIRHQDRSLNIMVKNNFIKENVQHEELPQSNIGLQNLRRRLELLYPKEYALTTAANNGTFTAALSLPIKEEH